MRNKRLVAGAILIAAAAFFADRPAEKTASAGSLSAQRLSFQVNGVSLNAAASHVDGKSLYVDPRESLDLLRIPYSYDAGKKKIEIKGTSYDVPAKNGVPAMKASDLAAAAGASFSASQDGSEGYLLALPKELAETKLDGGVSLYADASGFGYGVKDGKVVFQQWTVQPKAFAKSNAADNAQTPKNVPLPPIDHIDSAYSPASQKTGQPERYEIRAWFISHEDHAASKKNGESK